MDTQYTLFLNDGTIEEFGNFNQLKDKYEGFFPIDSFLFSNRDRVWFDYRGMMVLAPKEVPSYFQHLQLVLGL